MGIAEELSDDIDEMLELLSAANQIACRGGKDTNWKAYQAAVLTILAKFNRSGNTARTYRIVKSDGEIDRWAN